MRNPLPDSSCPGLGRLAAVGLAVLTVGGTALAQNTTNAPATAVADGTNQTAVTRLPEVSVQGRVDSLLGVATSASQGTVGAEELADRPRLRAGEILEAVPGVIITQHAGGGKANQYFLRGFNLDHGTDFAVFLDGMPLNLPSHAHGEGYSDLNTVIPELVERLDYEKGPYYADVGNFGSVGAAHLAFAQTLPQNFVSLEAGAYGFERGVFGLSDTFGPGRLLVGGEAAHDDGPWTHPDDYTKLNGLLTYSQGDAAHGGSVTARAYHGDWNSTDQIPESAIPQAGFFGGLNPTDGGTSGRYSLQGEWHADGDNARTRVMAYGFYYDLDLFSDFTYFLTDTNRGDQFEQLDRRWVAGLDASHARTSTAFGHEMVNTFGLQVRNDWINNGLFQTQDRVRVIKFDSATGTYLPATTAQDRFTDTQVGLYAENKIQWSDRFRSVATIRGDLDYFDVTSLTTPANSGASSSGLPSPKLSLVYGPVEKNEFYLQGGYSFHSNDGRGATQTVEPVSADNPSPNTPASRIPGLIQTRGAEVGWRTEMVPGLRSGVSLWYLHSDSELQLDGDTGGTVASAQPSDRFGVEWANYYTPIPHLVFDLDVAQSRARFSSVDAGDAAPNSPGGTRVPEAVGLVLAGGVTLQNLNGFSAGLRLRYFGPRDLTSDGEYRSPATLLLNAQAGYQINRRWRVSAELLNLLNRHDHDIDYAYTARTTPGGAPAFQDVFHPVEPFQVRFAVTAHF